MLHYRVRCCRGCSVYIIHGENEEGLKRRSLSLFYLNYFNDTLLRKDNRVTNMYTNVSAKGTAGFYTKTRRRLTATRRIFFKQQC